MSGVAVHLAAGQGKRLRPFTDDRPKPLVELGGRSLLERNIETLGRCGISEHVVVTGYRGDRIRELGLKTVENPFYDRTDMVYSLFRARDEFPEDRDLIISYGDIVYEDKIVEALLKCHNPVCVVVDLEWQKLWEARSEDPLDDAETLRMDENGFITEIGNKPENLEDIEAQYIGLINIRCDFIRDFVERYLTLQEDTEDGYVSVQMTNFLDSMAKDGWEIKAVPVHGGWIEVDTSEDLEMYRRMLEDGTLSKFVELRS